VSYTLNGPIPFQLHTDEPEGGFVLWHTEDETGDVVAGWVFDGNLVWTQAYVEIEHRHNGLGSEVVAWFRSNYPTVPLKHHNNIPPASLLFAASQGVSADSRYPNGLPSPILADNYGQALMGWLRATAV